MLKKTNQSSYTYTILILVLITFMSTNISYGQETGFIGGIGSSYGLNEDLLGVNGRLYYGANEEFCFGPELSFFPYQEVDNESEIQLIDVSFNAHYIFEVFEKFGIYPLSGINFSSEKERLIEENNESETVDEFGINYGVGVHYKVSNFYLFTEFSGIIGQLNDELITAGIIFNLGKSKRKETEE